MEVTVSAAAEEAPAHIMVVSASGFDVMKREIPRDAQVVINAADNKILGYLSSSNIAGHSRIERRVVDIGAFEYQGQSETLTFACFV